MSWEAFTVAREKITSSYRLSVNINSRAAAKVIMVFPVPAGPSNDNRKTSGSRSKFKARFCSSFLACKNPHYFVLWALFTTFTIKFNF
jgi:hypothetical protein